MLPPSWQTICPCFLIGYFKMISELISFLLVCLCLPTLFQEATSFPEFSISEHLADWPSGIPGNFLVGPYQDNSHFLPYEPSRHKCLLAAHNQKIMLYDKLSSQGVSHISISSSLSVISTLTFRHPHPPPLASVHSKVTKG